MFDRFEGTLEDIKAEVERIVQTIVPEATCEIWDSDEQIKCGAIDASGRKHEFSLVIGNLDKGNLEANSRALESSLIAQSPDGAFNEGYRDGWQSVVGIRPMPADRTRAPPDASGNLTPFELGFENGRVDALEQSSRTADKA